MNFLLTLLVSLIFFVQFPVFAQQPTLSTTVQPSISLSINQPAGKYPKGQQLKQPFSLTPKAHPSINFSITHQPRPTPDRLLQCETYKNAITNRVGKIVNSTTNSLSAFDSILVRVQEYYQTKVAPNITPAATSVATSSPVPSLTFGIKPLEIKFRNLFRPTIDYQVILMNIQTNKANVQTALEALKTSAMTFTCDPNNPVISKREFRNKTASLKKAVHAYKESIRNLIVGVRRLSSKNRPLPTIIISPTITPIPIVIIDISVTPSPTATESPSITPSLTPTP